MSISLKLKYKMWMSSMESKLQNTNLPFRAKWFTKLKKIHKIFVVFIISKAYSDVTISYANAVFPGNFEIFLRFTE